MVKVSSISLEDHVLSVGENKVREDEENGVASALRCRLTQVLACNVTRAAGGNSEE